MKKIKVIVHGSSGRMGREIAVCLEDHPQAEYFAGVDKSGLEDLPALKKAKGEKRPVLVDFSTPEGFRTALKWCVERRIPFVSGTTGLGEGDFKVMASAAKKIPVLWSANMSVGIQLLLRMINSIAGQTETYDVQIEEFHHRRKVDSPSGTGKLLQSAVEKSHGKPLPDILSGRGGGIFGIHKVWFMEEEEVITLEHTALNRRVFARGAVKAAAWLATQKPGRYEFSEVLDV